MVEETKKLVALDLLPFLVLCLCGGFIFYSALSR
jgi:hypothetical protein